MPMVKNELWYDQAGNLVYCDDPNRYVSAWPIGSEAPASAYPPGDVPAAPTLTSLNPATVPSGSEPIILSLIGTGFSSNCQIIFADNPEIGVCVSDTELTTKVVPELFAPATVQVYVQDNFGQQTAPLDFTFTAPAPPPPPEVKVHPLISGGLALDESQRPKE